MDMVVCKGITFRNQECRLKHSMVESVNINTGSLQSVQLACAKDEFSHIMLGRRKEVVVMLMMVMPIPSCVIILVILMSVMITWKTRRRETIWVEMHGRGEYRTELKQRASIYENLTFVAAQQL